MRRVFEYAFAAKDGLRILALWTNGRLLAGTTPDHRDKRIDIAAGEADDARLPIAVGNQRRQLCVDRPTQVFRACGTKLARGHKDYVLSFRQLCQFYRFQQIADDWLDSVRSQGLRHGLVAEAGHPHHADFFIRSVSGAPDELCEGWAHLASYAQY